jgi:hypothetical protein
MNHGADVCFFEPQQQQPLSILYYFHIFLPNSVLIYANLFFFFNLAVLGISQALAAIQFLKV